METKTITIGGEKFEISAPYAEGHTLTAAEARVLNQTRSENIGNNFRKRVSDAITKRDAGDSSEFDKLAELIAAADAEYSFSMPGQSTPRIVDPIEREAHKLAREYVGNQLKQLYGISLKGIHPDYKELPEEEAKAKSAERFGEAVAKVAQKDEILALAKKNVANKKKATEAAMEDLGI